MKLPRIYDHYVTGQILGIESLRQELGLSGNSLRKRVSELAGRGYLIPIRQGLYILNSPAGPLQKKASPQVRVLFDMPTPLEVGSCLTPTSAIGYASAMAHWAQVPLPRQVSVVVISKTKFNAFDFDGFSYLWCQDVSSLVQVQRWMRPGSPNGFRVTSLEQSLIDCLRRPKLCPQWTDFLAICERLPRPDPSRLVALSRCADSAALTSRLGLLLDVFQETWSIPKGFLSELAVLASHKDQLWRPALAIGLAELSVPGGFESPEGEREARASRAAGRLGRLHETAFERWCVWPEVDSGPRVRTPGSHAEGAAGGNTSDELSVTG